MDREPSVRLQIKALLFLTVLYFNPLLAAGQDEKPLGAPECGRTPPEILVDFPIKPPKKLAMVAQSLFGHLPSLQNIEESQDPVGNRWVYSKKYEIIICQNDALVSKGLAEVCGGTLPFLVGSGAQTCLDCPGTRVTLKKGVEIGEIKIKSGEFVSSINVDNNCHIIHSFIGTPPNTQILHLPSNSLFSYSEKED